MISEDQFIWHFIPDNEPSGIISQSFPRPLNSSHMTWSFTIWLHQTSLKDWGGTMMWNPCVHVPPEMPLRIYVIIPTSGKRNGKAKECLDLVLRYLCFFTQHTIPLKCSDIKMSLNFQCLIYKWCLQFRRDLLKIHFFPQMTALPPNIQNAIRRAKKLI